MRLSQLKFKTQMYICFTVVSVSVLLFFSGITGMKLWSVFLKDTEKSMSNQSGQIATNINEKIESYIQIMDLMCKDSSFLRALKEQEYGTAEAILNHKAASFLASTAGKIRGFHIYAKKAESNILTMDDLPDELEDKFMNNWSSRIRNELLVGRYHNPQNESVLSYYKRITFNYPELIYYVELIIYETEISGFYSKNGNEIIRVLDGNNLISSTEAIDQMEVLDKEQYIYAESFCEIGWKVEMYLAKDRFRSMFIEAYSELIWGIPIVLILVFVLVTILSGSMSRRMNILQKKVAFIAEGDFTYSYTLSGKDEFAELSVKLDECAHRIDRLIIENKESETRKRNAQVRSLRAQINSHFLFNALSGVKWFAEMKDYHKIIHSITNLSDFLHFSLSIEEDMVSVKEEIGHLEAYLYLQNMRYQDSLIFCLDIEEACMNQRTCRMILQPLVENSIYHGRREDERPLVIAIYSELHESDYELIVEDDGIGMSQERIAAIYNKTIQDSHGYGLKNVIERLEVCTNSCAELRIESCENEFTRIIVKQPLEMK